MELDAVQTVALDVAVERSLGEVPNAASRCLAACPPGVSLARIWLMQPDDLSSLPHMPRSTRPLEAWTHAAGMASLAPRRATDSFNQPDERKKP